MGGRRPADEAVRLGDCRGATARAALDADQTAADADQTTSDADQTAADMDQTASDADQLNARTDQFLSDRDQASADRDSARSQDDIARAAYAATRAQRTQVSFERRSTAVDRQRTAAEREATARERDALAAVGDEQAGLRDSVARTLEKTIGTVDWSLAQRLQKLREDAASDRAEAAHDRARAARDRDEAARERARLETELSAADMDDLTGAYRRAMGQLMLSHEMARARHGNGRFVLAFVDVDDLKGINDREGHAAGDQALRSVVGTIRHELRSYDPIVRYGGDEFVAGMGGSDLDEAERRFQSIRQMLARGAGVGISVGLAALADGESLDALTVRADRAMAAQRARVPRAVPQDKGAH